VKCRVSSCSIPREFLPTTLTPSQWEQFVSGARQLGEPQGSEGADYAGSLEELRASPPAPAVPTVVLTSDHQFDFGARGPETWPAWLRAQDQLARLLGARHITDTNSGHFIQGEQPQLVIEAIREIVDAARN
jgi:pimeloyl-ACP methyl ester carboxylesterase